MITAKKKKNSKAQSRRKKKTTKWLALTLARWFGICLNFRTLQITQIKR